MTFKRFIAFLIFAASTVSASSGFAQAVTCSATFHSSTQFKGESPGSLATAMDTPCLLTRYVNGAANGRRPPGRARRMIILQQPRNGRAEIVDRSSFVYTPKPGFTGSDTMLVHMSGLVRFAITVY